VPTRLENVGDLKNSGVVLARRAIFEAARRNLTAGIVATIDHNQVTSLGEGRSFIGTGDVNGQGQSGRLSQRIIVGEPLGTFWGPKFLRVNEAGKQVFFCAKQRPECVSGETTVPAGDDDQILGNANPDFSLGLTSNGR
jgi:iron complex outermembrane receptor protein